MTRETTKPAADWLDGRYPGKITPHWLRTAFERIAAGEDELDTLADYGYVRHTAIRLDPHHAATRRALSELAGAGRHLLKTIHDSGGWNVYDERHQEPMRRAMAAYEAATLIALDLPGIAEEPET